MIAGAKRWAAWSLNKKCLCRLIPVLVTLFLLSACGYHFAGSAADKLSPGQSLWVSFIKIEIDSPSAQTVLRRALLEESHALRGLYPASTAATADLRVNGNLRSYAVKTMSYSAQDQVMQFRLTIEVELELIRKGEITPIWKGTLQSFQDYPANSSNLALQRSSEEAALAAASRILAQKFLMAVEQAY
jgi:outer membrane lipopolysaccharide assembly protein LptE/RlpB